MAGEAPLPALVRGEVRDGSGAYTVEVYSDFVRLPRCELHVTPGADLRLDLRPPPLDLVARWSAEGDARDGRGNHDGELQGEVTFAPGVVGQAFRFGGEGGIVRVPNVPERNPGGSFSLARRSCNWWRPARSSTRRWLGTVRCIDSSRRLTSSG